jgi:hypothetical protein
MLLIPFATNYILVQIEVVLHLVIQLHNHMDGVVVIYQHSSSQIYPCNHDITWKFPVDPPLLKYP